MKSLNCVVRTENNRLQRKYFYKNRYLSKTLKTTMLNVGSEDIPKIRVEEMCKDLQLMKNTTAASINTHQ